MPNNINCDALGAAYAASCIDAERALNEYAAAIADAYPDEQRKARADAAKAVGFHTALAAVTPERIRNHAQVGERIAALRGGAKGKGK